MFLLKSIIQIIKDIPNVNDMAKMKESDVYSAINKAVNLCFVTLNNNIKKLCDGKVIIGHYERMFMIWDQAVYKLNKDGIYIIKKDGLKDFILHEKPTLKAFFDNKNSKV